VVAGVEPAAGVDDRALARVLAGHLLPAHPDVPREPRADRDALVVAHLDLDLGHRPPAEDNRARTRSSPLVTAARCSSGPGTVIVEEVSARP
jgi:hypothetical protein